MKATLVPYTQSQAEVIVRLDRREAEHLLDELQKGLPALTLYAAALTEHLVRLLRPETR